MVQLKSMNKFDVFVGLRKGREGNPHVKSSATTLMMVKLFTFGDLV